MVRTRLLESHKIEGVPNEGRLAKMRVIPKLEEKVIKSVVRDWLRLLESEDYAAATAFLLINDGPNGFPWSPDTLKSSVNYYGHLEKVLPGPDFKITPIENAGGQPARFDVNLGTRIADNPSIVGDVWLDLPLNGETSEVTAEFYIHRVNGGFALELSDIRVH